MAGFTLTALSLILAGAGTATQVYGQKKAGDAAKASGEAQKKASESQAQLADFNASVAELQAKDAIERGAEAESRFRTTIKATIGSQRAGIAAGNIDVGFGSAPDVQADAAFLGELDALTIRTNAARESWGYNVQAQDLRKRGRHRAEGRRLPRSSGRPGQERRESGGGWLAPRRRGVAAANEIRLRQSLTAGGVKRCLWLAPTARARSSPTRIRPRARVRRKRRRRKAPGSKKLACRSSRGSRASAKSPPPLDARRTGKRASCATPKRSAPTRSRSSTRRTNSTSGKIPRLYDPQSGALSVHGKDAMPLPEQIAGEYDQVTGAIAMGLGNDRQKLAFAKVKESRGQQLDLTIRKHVYGEMQRYEGQELQSTITNATNNAIANASDPRRVGMELARAVDAIKTHAPRLGLGPEEVAQQVDAVTTKTHVGVIEGLLAQDQTKTAQVYFDETKSAIKGEALARIEKALSVGKTRSEGQKAADAIVAAGGTLTEQREKARAIDDPDVRDNVMQRIEHEDAVKEKVQREAEQATLTNAYGIVDRTKSVDGIPPADVVTLANHMPALRAYAIARAKGVPVETDYPTYYGLLSKAGDDPAAFVKENLLTYRAKLDDGEFKQLADIQLRIKNGDRAAADKATSGLPHARSDREGLADQLRHRPDAARRQPGGEGDRAVPPDARPACRGARPGAPEERRHPAHRRRSPQPVEHDPRLLVEHLPRRQTVL
jgi:hypothetical protein